MNREQVQHLAEQLLLEGACERLRPHEHRALAQIARRLRPPRNPNDAIDESLTLGERLADRIAEIGGSWSFILGFVLFLLVWAMANLALPMQRRFDPYPFIFLNLILSMLAALQAPVIMMSQNRQAKHDRLAAQLDYEINMKAEAEIARLAVKVDRLLEAEPQERVRVTPRARQECRTPVRPMRLTDV